MPVFSTNCKFLAEAYVRVEDYYPSGKLEVLRGSDGAELNGDSIPGVTIVDAHENNLGMPIWKDSQTGCEIHWVGDSESPLGRGQISSRLRQSIIDQYVLDILEGQSQ